ncbi:MAG: methylenetetrahydrofolate--tRNA-(uracil(54)-C(5))-methyltransferase (FADH(2)-oxidizing) TrmFO [Desulfuromonadales bacterium]|nr:methylenetetrahydrofolate--tRNA-(uracil(54)-C(5))-methyltransferase (FADH(2)-oxidizing) TrmFO [Desulfuromonadales bacterium]
MPTSELIIIGGGLAGCEAAWQAARRGLDVALYEMKPLRFSPAHQSDRLGELVCSNSLRGAALGNAVGLLKEELRRCGSLFMAAADATAVPAGGALAVDREAFAALLTERIESHPRITLQRQEVTALPPTGTVIVASGPLTSEALSAEIARRTGAEQLYFYDAIAPIVEAESIDLTIAWRASRYGKGGDDYLNCPLSREEYFDFLGELRQAEKVAPREFEKMIHFEGCMPIEEMAERGDLTLAFGPMKPVGLPDPRTGREPFAVIQLRQDDRHATLYNMVGFQTKLTWPEQRRIFRRIPGLAEARFARLGSMHRNTFLNAPACLSPTLQLQSEPRLFFAGQITGVEGYVESAACGLLAGLFAACRLRGEEPPMPPAATALGSLLAHLSQSSPAGFQPMNVNYGLFPPLPAARRKRADRRLALAERALAELEPWRLQAFPEAPGGEGAP